jgi:hypothetical protein
MPHCTPSHRCRQIETLRRHFAQADGLPFANVLPAQRLEEALAQEKATWREKVFTPVLTLWAFLSQVSSADGSLSTVGSASRRVGPMEQYVCAGAIVIPTAADAILGRLEFDRFA